MARFTTILLACLAIGTAYAQEPGITATTSAIVVTTPVPENTTTPEPTSTTAGTTIPPTNTTTATTTTATTATTTTTTTEPTTTSTTAKPTTTTTSTSTTSGPITTKAPLPAYPNNGQLWFVNKTDQQPCLAFKAAMGIKHENMTTSVPATASASGNCSDGSISFLLTWDEGSVLFTVINGSETKKDVYWFANATVTLKGVEYDMSNTSEALFKTPVDASYKCQSETIVKLTKGTELLVSSLQTEAFSSKPAEPHFSFSSAQECKADDVSAVVPVTVGVALIVLVVIVLVAYIIGRKRSRSRGYQSV